MKLSVVDPKQDATPSTTPKVTMVEVVLTTGSQLTYPKRQLALGAYGLDVFDEAGTQVQFLPWHSIFMLNMKPSS